MKALFLPACWLIGHDRPESEDKPGWFAIDCMRCGRPFNKPYPWQVVRYKIPYMFLWLANKTAGDNVPTYYPRFRAIDQHLPGIGGKYSCGAYSYEGIASLIKQYADDGLPEPLLKDLISDEGWTEITEDNADEMLAAINESFETEANRQERERTMKIMRGELPREDEQ